MVNLLVLLTVFVQQSLLCSGERVEGALVHGVARERGTEEVTLPAKQSKERRAFVSFLEASRSAYIKGAIALGYSIKKNSGCFTSENHPDMILMTLGDLKDDPYSRSILEQVGWKIRPVVGIQPFKKGCHPRFKNQFAKLLLWSWTEYDSIVFMDADTVVKGSVRELFEAAEKPGSLNLMAATDCMGSSFNAGVMVIRPDKALFDDMMRVGPRTNYHAIYAEQNFLNVYFKNHYTRISSTYNFHSYLLVVSKDPDFWKSMWGDARIVHLAKYKPFLGAKPDKRLAEGHRVMINYWNEMYDEAWASIVK